ncbi:MAG: hypothetical protein C4320_08040, partial [Armatimonadota bacterium]
MTSMLAATTLLFLNGGMASSDPFKPGKQEQVKLGQQASDQIRKKERILPASDMRVQTLRRVGERLLSNVDLRNEPWKFTFDVIESKDVNAFALPGGPVFFYTGILDRMRSEDELAGVLGHEMTHVFREHWAYSMRDAQKKDIGITLGSLFGIRTDVLRGAALLSSITDLSFSRSHETQADETGFAILVRAGYNPEGMVTVFKMLQSLGGKQPEFLSSHPDPGNRVKRLQSFITKTPRAFPALTP